MKNSVILFCPFVVKCNIDTIQDNLNNVKININKLLNNIKFYLNCNEVLCNQIKK